ncbi:MAG TPA: tetratricopeptide repeat protein [Verrucomicrobiae bacterium]|nr:tetratricopeptide repeat protein [Verrucomicrobiae bacterium]
MNERSESGRAWVDAVVVFGLTVAAHVQGLWGQFVDWDDTSHITRNVAIRSLSLHNLRIMFTQPTAKLYCPLTWLSFAIDYRIWGRDPFGYHLTNLALHVANTLLVLVLVRRMLRGRTVYAGSAALLTAVMFGVHPLHVESVAWATERKDVLFVFFYLLGMIGYLRWVERRKVADYGICFGLFVASALAKSTAVTFPVVLLLIDHFVAKRKAWAEKIPFFAVSLIIAGITFVCQSGGVGETVAAPSVIPLWARAGLVGYCSLFYVGKFFWPVHLSAVYPVFDEMHWSIGVSLGYVAAFAVVTAVAFALRRRWPVVWASWLFYLVALSPTVGLVPVGIHVVADRYAHLALLGLMMPVGMLGAAAAGAMRGASGRAMVGGAIALVCAGLTLLAGARTEVWANTETLFLDALQRNPDCLPAHINLTYWYTEHRDFERAIQHGKRAVEIAPDGIPGRKNLAYAYINMGDRREAIRVLRPLAQKQVGDPDVWRALAECFDTLGDTNNAKLARQSERTLEGKL